MKQWKIYVLLFMFSAAVLQVVPATAQYSKTQCPPKKKFWKSKQTNKWLSYKEPKNKQRKEVAEVVKPQPAKVKAVAKKQKKDRYRKDKRYVKRLRAIKKESKTMASSTSCPH